MVVLLYSGDVRAGGYPLPGLSGLDGISVVIEDLDKDAQKAGLTQERLETVVALRLRRAGIPIFKHSTEQKGNPFLYVKVNALNIENSPLFAYTVNVELCQDVWIQRESPLEKNTFKGFSAATTGERRTMGYAGRSVFANTVVEVVEGFVDDFALAYLTNKEAEKSFVPSPEGAGAVESPSERPEEKPVTKPPTGKPVRK
jgi:hypothetical protein